MLVTYACYMHKVCIGTPQKLRAGNLMKYLYFHSCTIYHLLCSLEMKTDEAFSSAQQFYKDLGDIAVEKGYA